MEVKNICVGKDFTDKQGNKKTQWSVIGKMFIKEDGKMSILIESIPIGWTGNAMVFDQKADNQTATQAQQHEPHQEQVQQQVQTSGNVQQGDLPF